MTDPSPPGIVWEYQLHITSYDSRTGRTLGPRILDAESEAEALSWLDAAISLAPQPVVGAPSRIEAVLYRRVVPPWVVVGTREWTKEDK